MKKNLKTKSRRSPILLILLTLVFAFSASIIVQAQSDKPTDNLPDNEKPLINDGEVWLGDHLLKKRKVKPQNDKPILAPAEETFLSADGLVSLANTFGDNEYARNSDLGIYRIYNSDGSIWYKYSVIESSPLHYNKNPKEDLKSFRKPFDITLRIKNESEHWFEVIVNEETGETKYTLINDPRFSYRTYRSFMGSNGYIKFDPKKNPLRNKPNGELLEVEIDESSRFIPVYIKGDWLDISVNQRSRGWIKWRDKDGKLLIWWD